MAKAPLEVRRRRVEWYSPVVDEGQRAGWQRQQQAGGAAGRRAHRARGAGAERGGLHRAPMCTGRARLAVCAPRLPPVAFLKIIRKNVTRAPPLRNSCDANILPIPRCLRFSSGTAVLRECRYLFSGNSVGINGFCLVYLVLLNYKLLQ